MRAELITAPYHHLPTSNLAPGNWLLRHDIIALLHLPTSFHGTEYYPACAQLKVGGSGTVAPRQSELVVFPSG
ncbi:hypothetical protein BDQ12DRAFT_723859 [Crucibulum laeve]|uniref:AA9 family lytic polysaccharide monooxygenase n=1 Tax=Crucibulum laeve TaxID=68775 RepID=A0A5C3LX08_9AGAR|nr:hypothetical protein BDQ12DRAFT_723859 [Crucibulum laeve]